MDETLFVIVLIAWVLSGFIGAGWLMLKGYTMEMFGCLGVLYGGVLALIALFGPLMLFIAWALPSRTDPTQEGGVKKLLTPRASRKELPTSTPRPAAPSRPAIRASESRRPAIPDSAKSSRPAIPSTRSSSSRPKPPARRS
ncbi:MAG: hypothetical protein JXA21_07425 [Anaerolineae bacterium]|nr:hypothetical protein [Anaerolineae bacterium]